MVSDVAFQNQTNLVGIIAVYFVGKKLYIFSHISGLPNIPYCSLLNLKCLSL